MPTATQARIVAASSSKPLAVAAASPTTGKPARVSGVAYSGGPLTQPWSDSVVVDLAGLDTSKSAYHLLKDHGWTSEDAVPRLGTCVVAKTATELRVSGELFTHSALAERIKLDALAGAPFEFSIRSDVLASREVPAGEVVRVNGRTFAGPFTLVTASRLREVSIVELGADPATQFEIAARARRVSAADGTTPTRVRIADIDYAWLLEHKPDALIPTPDSPEYDEETHATKAPAMPETTQAIAAMFPGARGRDPGADWRASPVLRAEWRDCEVAFRKFAEKQLAAGESYLVPLLDGPIARASRRRR
jgi:hypothetical protein